MGTVCYEIRGATLHLQSLAVDPVWQRQGIGRALVAHAVDLARPLGASRLSLYIVVETGNVIIFERLGFRVVSTESGCGLEAVAAATVTEVYMESVRTVSIRIWIDTRASSLLHPANQTRGSFRASLA